MFYYAGISIGVDNGDINNNNIVHDNSIAGVWRTGISISGKDGSHRALNNTVYKNTIESCGDGIYYRYSDGGNIYDNISRNNTDTRNAGEGYGIAISRANNHHVYGNTVYGNRTEGIALWSSATSSQNSNNNMVYKNYSYSNSSFGIGMTGSNGADNNDVYENILYNNTGSGIRLSAANTNSDIYNNTSVGNSNGIFLASSAASISIKNNILSNNTNYALNITGTNLAVFNHNLYYVSSGNVLSVNGVNYTAEQVTSVDSSGINQNPNLSNPSGGDFTLTSTSPAIDAGTDVSLTSDYASNPIYGLPDIGAYEYQPTKEIGTNSVYKDADITVYGNEKFRDRESESGGAVDFSLTLPGSTKTDYVNVDITTWANSGTRQKTWTEDSTVSTLTNTVHTIGDLEANKYYNVTVDDNITNLTGDDCQTLSSKFFCLSDDDGKIVFTYTGTYSEHEFNVEEGDNTGPVTTASPEGDTYTSTQTVTLTCNDNSGVGCDKTYYTLDGTTPTTSSTEYITPITIATDITLKFFSTDLNGESEFTKTETYVFESGNDDDDEKDLNVNKVKTTSTENSITITWKTDHNTKSTIRYGIDKNLKEKKKDNSKEKKHKVILNNLTPNIQYYFRIKAEDGDNNEDRSKIHSIKTLADSNLNLNSNNVTVAKTVAPAYSGDAKPNVCAYTVQFGDTLWKIAQGVYGNRSAYPLIIEKNKDKYPNIASVLVAGQELTLGCENATGGSMVKGIVDSKSDDSGNVTEINNESSSGSGFKWWNPFSWF